MATVVHGQESPFQVEDLPTGDRFGQLVIAAEKIEAASRENARAAKLIASTISKLLVIVVAFVLLWGVEVVLGIQRIIAKGF